MDEPGFDAQAYAKRLIKNNRLGVLLEERRRIASEASNMDYEMQTVVYENYSSLVGASEIVKDLDNALSGFETNFSELDSVLTEVVKQSDAIDKKLNEQQKNIVEMNQARNMLHKLSLLFRLPRKMKAALDRQAYDIVTDLYEEAKPVLSKCSDHGAVTEIMEQVESYRGLAAESLRSNLMSSPARASDIVVMLAKLDEPIDSLIDIFLACQKRRVKADLSNIESCMSIPIGDMRNRMEGPVDGMIQTLCQTISVSKSIFDTSNRFEIIMFSKESIYCVLEVLKTYFQDRIKGIVAGVVGLTVTGHPEEQDLSDQNVSNLEDPLSVQEISRIFNFMKDRLQKLDKDVPEAFPLNMLNEMISSVIQFQFDALFTGLYARYFLRLKDIYMKILISEGSGDDPRSYAFIKTEMKSAEVHLLQDFGLVRSTGMTWVLQEWIRKEWIDVVLQFIVGSWRYVLLNFSHSCAAMLQIESDKEERGEKVGLDGYLEYAMTIPMNFLKTDRSPLMCLCVSKLVRSMYTILGARIADLLQGIGLAHPSGQSQMSLQPCIPERLLSLAGQTFSLYTILMKERLFSQVKSQFLVLEKVETLGGPSPVAQTMVSTVQRIEVDMKNVEFVSSPEGQEIEKSQQETDLNQSVAQVASAVAAAGLHALLECIQKTPLLSLSKVAFQQIQVDAHFLVSKLVEIMHVKVDDEEPYTILQSLPIVAAEHCQDPVVLDPIILDKLILETGA